MRRLLPSATLASAAICIASGLSGCALLRVTPPVGQFLKPSAQRLQLTHGFHDPKVVDVAYRDPTEYEEYVRMKGQGQAEAILSVANGPQMTLQFPQYQIHRLTETWKFNRDAQLTWQPPGLVHLNHRAFTYARYQRQSAGEVRHCFAFWRAWGIIPDDPRQRPGKAMFGYYCAAPGENPRQNEIVAVLKGIKTRTDHIPRVYFGQDIPHDRGAIQLARGASSANFGNSRFPFQFSIKYYPGGGSSWP